MKKIRKSIHRLIYMLRFAVILTLMALAMPTSLVLALDEKNVGFTQAQQIQIIAIAALEKSENSLISPKAARAPYYSIFDERGKLLEVISNPFYNNPSSTGPRVADLLAKKNVTLVVAGAFGYKMLKALEIKGIKHYEANGAVKKYAENQKSAKL